VVAFFARGLELREAFPFVVGIVFAIDALPRLLAMFDMLATSSIADGARPPSRFGADIR